MQTGASVKNGRVNAGRALEAADAFFLSDETRGRTANELAYTRIGVIGCFAMGLATIAFIPWQRFNWPPSILFVMFGSGLFSIALPFLLRQREAIRVLGHFVCAYVSAYVLAVVALSGGRATGVFPVLPMIPMLALLMGGGRAVIGWSLGAAGILGLGAALESSHAAPLVASFAEFQQAERYPTTLICLLAMLGVTLLFEKLWHRSALELVERARRSRASRGSLSNAARARVGRHPRPRCDGSHPVREPCGGALDRSGSRERRRTQARLAHR